ncbi:MAG: Ku protein [Lachnospiraceae bacterium]|nr:Ku protein [Lachnospiraceae bacterium]
MPVANKTVISFGLVAIPIAMYTAVQDNDIHFNQLHKEDEGRIRYKKTCAHCNEEVKQEDIVKGYQYDKDNYVVVTDEELEKIKTAKEKSIQIIHFANLNQISPIYYDKAYHVLPDKGGNKAFELFRVALMEQQKIAIGKTILGSKEKIMAIIPRDDGIVIQTMFFEDEIKEIPKSYQKPDVNEEELKMGKILIDSMDTPFDPNNYFNEYQAKLKQLLDDKVAGKEIKAPKEPAQSNIIDLMEALKLSVEQSKKPKRGTAKKQEPPKKQGRKKAV